MARLPRLLVAGLPHLLSQRVQHGQSMVRDDDDRRSLVQLLHAAALEHRVALHAYCVHERRFDLVAAPEQAAGLSRLMQTVARRHAAAYNRRYQRTGGLWEGRFRAALIEPAAWLLTCMVYVEQLAAMGSSRNEGRDEAPWSSHAAHCGRATDPLLTDPAAYWALGNTPFEREAAYGKRYEQLLTSQQREQIETAMRGGWVLGTAAFAAKLASVDRPASPRLRGRPRKTSV